MNADPMTESAPRQQPGFVRTIRSLRRSHQGAHIVSVLAPGKRVRKRVQQVHRRGRYILASGTSLAAPMITGLIADLLQINPKSTPDQVKGALLSPDARSSTTLAEVRAASLAGLSSPPLGDQGLTANVLVGSGGAIDYSLSRGSTAPATLSAEFAKSSYVCSCLTSGPGSIDPSLSRWSMGSWSTFPVTADSK